MSTVFARVAAFPLLAAATVLAGCAAPDLGPRPGLRAPATLESARSLPVEAGDVAWPDARWWTAYGDPALDALVAEALASSPDVAIAAARIRQAEGASRIAGAASSPQLGGQGEAALAKQSYNMGIPAEFVPQGWISTGSLALTGQFDLDLWGRQKAALEAATSAERAARVDAEQAVLMLSTNVVSSYFDLARLIERHAALTRALDARRTLADLAGKRRDAGLENDAPVRQALGRVEQARGAVSANSEAIAMRRHALAALLGAGPDRGLSITPATLTATPETALPADAGIALAGRRPDIVAARLRAEAAGARIREARAAFLPDISLRGLIGLTSLGLDKLFDSGSTYGQVGPAVSLPIFSGGRLEGQFAQARGSYDEAVASYNKTVVGALQDVADAYAGRQAAREQEAAARSAERQAQAGFEIAMKRYDAGLGTYLDALVAQDNVLAARETAIDAHFRTLARDVALTRALGGGFEAPLIEEARSNDR